MKRILSILFVLSFVFAMSARNTSPSLVDDVLKVEQSQSQQFDVVISMEIVNVQAVAVLVSVDIIHPLGNLKQEESVFAPTQKLLEMSMVTVKPPDINLKNWSLQNTTRYKKVNPIPFYFCNYL